MNIETQSEDIKINVQLEFNIHLQKKKKKNRKGRRIPVSKLLAMEINLNPDIVPVIQYLFSVKEENKRKINTSSNINTSQGGEGLEIVKKNV